MCCLSLVGSCSLVVVRRVLAVVDGCRSFVVCCVMRFVVSCLVCRWCAVCRVVFDVGCLLVVVAALLFGVCW